MKKIFLALIVIMITSCASTKQYKKFTDKEPIPTEKARIYLLRTGNFGGFVKFNTFLDNQENKIGEVGPKSFICFDVPPGEHKIVIKAETERFYTINAQPGKVYYLRLIPKMGVNYARVNFEILDEAEGIKEVDRLKKPKVMYAE